MPAELISLFNAQRGGTDQRSRRYAPRCEGRRTGKVRDHRVAQKKHPSVPDIKKRGAERASLRRRGALPHIDSRLVFVDWYEGKKLLHSSTHMKLPNIWKSKFEKPRRRCRIPKVYMELFFIETESNLDRWIKNSNP